MESNKRISASEGKDCVFSLLIFVKKLSCPEPELSSSNKASDGGAGAGGGLSLLVMMMVMTMKNHVEYEIKMQTLLN